MRILLSHRLEILELIIVHSGCVVLHSAVVYVSGTSPREVAAGVHRRKERARIAENMQEKRTEHAAPPVFLHFQPFQSLSRRRENAQNTQNNSKNMQKKCKQNAKKMHKSREHARR